MVLVNLNLKETFMISTAKFWNIKNKTPWSESARELYRPSDRRLSAKLVPTFMDRVCHVVSVTDPYGRNLGFLDRSRYFFLQVAPQSYSRGWVDPVPDPSLLRKSGSAGNWTRASSCFYWAHLSRFHLKTETESSLQNVVYLNKRQNDG
jgi:hypothetical protein